MSGRRRRSESLWDRKEEEEMSGKVPYSSFRGDGSPKHSNFEANDGNDNIPMDNDNRHGIKMDPAFDEWENQYSSRPSDNSYDLPYRSGDRGTGNMSKDRDRSRGRDRERGSMRSRSRSRSRSRGRGSDERREFYESGDSRVSSRPCKDFASGNCRRGVQCRFLHQEPLDSRGGGDLMTEKYSGGSRKGSDGYRKDTGRKSGGDRDHTTSSGDDYHRGNRNAYDDQDQRRQSTRAPCRFFMMGKCNRTNCKFSHDVPKSAGYEGRPPHDNSRPWNERQPQDQSGFSDFDDKSKGWTGPTWNDLESGGFADSILDEKNRRTWDTNGSEKNSSQPRSDTNYMDMNQESQIIQSHSQHVMPETTSGSQSMVSNQQLHSYGSSDFLPSMDFQYPSTLNGTEKSSEMPSSNGSAQGMFLHLDIQKQTDIQAIETSRNDTDASKEQACQVSVSLPQIISPNLNLANALELLYSLPNTASAGAPIDSMVVEQNLDTKSREQCEKASRDGVPVEQGNQVSSIDPNPTKLDGKQEAVGNLEVKEGDKNENLNAGKSEAQGKVEEGNISNDEKAMRQFKVVLVEFVKEILKPTWKEGKMSREVYKTIVKKVVDKVTSTIQGNQIPRTQEKIDQYLAFSKSKITKLVEAYVGRFLKA